MQHRNWSKNFRNFHKIVGNSVISLKIRFRRLSFNESKTEWEVSEFPRKIESWIKVSVQNIYMSRFQVIFIPLNKYLYKFCWKINRCIARPFGKRVRQFFSSNEERWIYCSIFNISHNPLLNVNKNWKVFRWSCGTSNSSGDIAKISKKSCYLEIEMVWDNKIYISGYDAFFEMFLWVCKYMFFDKIENELPDFRKIETEQAEMWRHMFLSLFIISVIGAD